MEKFHAVIFFKKFDVTIDITTNACYINITRCNKDDYIK